MSDSENRSGGADGERRRPTVWQITKSTLAAALGVQTPEARERDFSSSSPLPFIIAGVAFTLVFIIVLVVVVNIVLSSAGA